jgi:hypothetical protein
MSDIEVVAAEAQGGGFAEAHFVPILTRCRQ